MEKLIGELLGKQAQLRERRATLETSWADAHKSGVSMQRSANTPTTSTPCVSLHRPHAPGTRSSQMSFTPAPVSQRKTRSRPRATTSPPPSLPVFEISYCFAPLRDTEHNAVIVGNSIIWYVRSTLAEAKADFCSTHLNDRSTCSVQSIQTVSVLRKVRSKYQFNAGSRKNLTVIKPEKC